MTSSRGRWQPRLLALGFLALGACGPEALEETVAPEAAQTANTLTLADYPIRASADQRYLVTATGAPFQYVADTPWALPSKLTQAEVIAYLEDRKAKGFNTIQVMLLPMLSLWTKNVYGDVPFNNMNPASPAITSVATTDPTDASGYDYWDHVEWVIDQAGQRGLQVAAAVAWYGYGGRDWRPYMTTAASSAYGAFLGQRFGGKNNLFWILGGDNNPIGDVASVPAGMDTSDRVEATNALANAIRANEAKRHLMSYHAKRRSSSAAYFLGQAWHTVHFAYSPETTYSYVLTDYNRTTVRPVVMPESYYDARTSTPILDRRRLRAQAWWSYLSGAVGFAYGHENVWDMDSAWKTAGLPAASATDIQNLASFLAGYRTHLLRPDHRTGNTVKLLAAGYGTTSTNGGLDYGVSAIASDGSFGMAYLPTARSDLSVNLAALGGGSVTLSWWNPGVGGAKTLIGTYAGTGTRALAWPSGYTDALLVVERAGGPASGSLYRAINLGGPALTIDGRAWEGSTSGAPNLTLTGTRFEDQTIALVPSTDAARAQMIRSCIYSTTAAVTLGSVPSGTYDVYLYVWEDNATKTFDVRAEGVLVQDDYVSGNPGQWKRLGPWTVSVTDGALNVATSGGTANLSGIEVYHH